MGVQTGRHRPLHSETEYDKDSECSFSFSFTPPPLPVLQLLLCFSRLQHLGTFIQFGYFQVSPTVGLSRDKYICEPEIPQTPKTKHQMALSGCSQSERRVLKLERIILNKQFSSGTIFDVRSLVMFSWKGSLSCISPSKES